MDVSEDASLSEALSELKSQGSSVLVAGAVPDDRHASLSRQLLGDPSEGSRRNVLVLTEDRSEALESRLPPGVSLDGPNRPEVIRVQTCERSAGATTATGIPATTMTTVDAKRLDELATTIYDSIADLGDPEDFSPAELRLGLDSLSPLIHLHGEEKVFKMLHLLIHALQRRQAMAHFHLPVDSETKAVRLLRPLFDVFVELRWTNSHVQQRWHIADGDVVTDWLEV